MTDRPHRAALTARSRDMGAAPTPLRLPGSGGIELAADSWGADDATPVVLLHGGGQTRGAWGAAGPQLAALGWRALAVDLRGHGESHWSPDRTYSLGQFTADVHALTTALATPPVLVGASLGGLSALLAVGALNTAARALVLVDVAHRHSPEGGRRVVEFMAGAPEGFESVAEAAAAVRDYLPHRPPPADDTGLRRNLRRHGDRWVWHWDPRLLDGLAGANDEFGAVLPHLDALNAARLPTLLVRGGLSDVLSEDIADEFCRLVPHAERVDVNGAGHMVAGDRNDRFIDAILPFLDRVRSHK